MRNTCLILIILLAISCKNKNGTNADSKNFDSARLSTLSLKDTVYLRNDSAIVPKDIYLNLDSIKTGSPYTDKAGIYCYYRLLFTSSEETRSFYIEKIQIVGDGIVKLEKRFKIPLKTLGLDFDSPAIDFVKWQSPEIIEIKVNGKTVELNISKMKVIEPRY